MKRVCRGMGRVLTGLFLLSLLGCASTAIEKSHPLFIEHDAQPHANVYFLRLQTQRPRGVSDNALRVELDEKPVLELAKGEYALVEIKPTTTDVIVRSMTFMTAQANPLEVWRSRRYTFEAGKTYYLLMKQDIEEFRGTYFVPQMVDAATAGQMARDLRPVGKATRKHPIPTP